MAIRSNLYTRNQPGGAAASSRGRLRGAPCSNERERSAESVGKKISHSCDAAFLADRGCLHPGSGHKHSAA
jgi:hypothetical protein